MTAILHGVAEGIKHMCYEQYLIPILAIIMAATVIMVAAFPHCV